MAAEGHKHPNYMAIFYLLAVLTVGEIAVVFLPHYTSVSKLTVGVFLCAFAIVKAALVAMYFMHLKFETRTLGLIAVTPLAIATLLVFVILPDASFVPHTTANKPAAEEPAKH
jgi:cytochrome c oxidase subunit 4